MASDLASPAPRTLLLAVDAVPFRVADAAVGHGGLTGFGTPTAIVSPFPTVTNVAFSSLFLPLGSPPSPRYELRHFDVEANATIGGSPIGYARSGPPWSTYLDVPSRSLVTELSNYVSPPWAARRELEDIECEVLTSPHDDIVAYLGATDGLLHLYDDARAVAFLVQLGERLTRLAQRHLDERGRQLRIVVFSDHGCGRSKVRHATGFDRLLRQAGLRVVRRLGGPDDVVAPRFGLVNYGALFVGDRGRARVAAEAVAGHEGVDLAAFAPEPNVVEVVYRTGQARVRWRGPEGSERYAYEEHGGDPLRLVAVRSELASRGELDGDGYADDAVWLEATAFGAFPDPLRRLAQALTGDRVRSRADVLVSLGPSWAWGPYSAVLGAWVRGGRLEGTHGGLDHGSSLGFLLVNDPSVALPAAVRADVALAPFVDGSRRRPTVVGSHPVDGGPSDAGDVPNGRFRFRRGRA